MVLGGGQHRQPPFFPLSPAGLIYPSRLLTQDYNLVGIQKRICKTRIWLPVFTTMILLACAYLILPSTFLRSYSVSCAWFTFTTA